MHTFRGQPVPVVDPLVDPRTHSVRMRAAPLRHPRDFVGVGQPDDVTGCQLPRHEDSCMHVLSGYRKDPTALEREHTGLHSDSNNSTHYVFCAAATLQRDCRDACAELLLGQPMSDDLGVNRLEFENAGSQWESRMRVAWRQMQRHV
ncbi:hypothetical protein MHYP_G00010720 [Metynnis hypsauchen]